jgi:hypothetical protein
MQHLFATLFHQRPRRARRPRRRIVSILTAAGLVLSAAAGLTAAGATVGVTAAQASSSMGGPITWTEVQARAKYWIDHPPAGGYDESGSAAGPGGEVYRTDCSGYVSMALHLSNAGGGLNTDGLAASSDFAHLDSPSLLQPGDILDATGAGPAGHVVLFAGWTSSDHTEYIGYEFGGGSAPVKRIVTRYPYDYDNRDFQPYHYKNLQPVTPPAPPRFDGQFDHVVNDGAGTVHLAGWTFDRQASGASIQVEVRDGAAADAPVLGMLPANVSRPDVDAAFKITGNHGFDGYLTGLQAGEHHLVLAAVDGGAQSFIDDADYTVAAPQGNLEHALSSSPDAYHIAGWAYDPDLAAASIRVDVYIRTASGDQLLGSLSANIARADVDRNLAITGDHGFDGIITAPSGTHTFDIYAVSGSSHAVIATNTFTIA